MRLHLWRPAQARLKPGYAPARVRAAGSRRKGLQWCDLQDALLGPCRHDGGRPDGRLRVGRLPAPGSIRADRAVARSTRGRSPRRSESCARRTGRGAEAACAAQACGTTAGTEETRRTEAGPVTVGGSRSRTATGTGGGPAATLCAGTCGIAERPMAGPATALIATSAEFALADSAPNSAMIWRFLG